MIQFAEQFPNSEIVVPLARQLSWSHFLTLLPLKSMGSKLFYAKNAIEQNWGKRELREQINRKAYERSEIANSLERQEQHFVWQSFSQQFHTLHC